MNYKWTLIYTAATKTYELTQYQLVGETWYKMGGTEWTSLTAALDHIGKVGQVLVK